MSKILSHLNPGEFVVVPRSRENCLSHAAKRLGITIAKRRLGSDDTTTVYRVA